jgi:hypothetical protein
MPAEQKTAAAPQKTVQGGGLHSYTIRWNELAREAIALGIPKVRVHAESGTDANGKWRINTFASYAVAKARVAWLEGQIAAKKTVAVEAPAQKAKQVRKAKKAKKAKKAAVAA